MESPTRYGHWKDLGVLKDYPKPGINCYHTYVCNWCGCMHRVKILEGGKALNANYCPNCGADMRSGRIER